MISLLMQLTVLANGERFFSGLRLVFFRNMFSFFRLACAHAHGGKGF